MSSHTVQFAVYAHQACYSECKHKEESAGSALEMQAQRRICIGDTSTKENLTSCRTWTQQWTHMDTRLITCSHNREC